jgi:2-polyprenyl-6-hydroxyphenyl methylase/3-demethylubiquinone-9 3-methyltransferase
MPIIGGPPPEELEDVHAGRLPARYGHRMQDVFIERLRPLLVEGVTILDVGAGRDPTLAPGERPAGCRYVGLDVSAKELEAAGAGAYDASYVHDIDEPLAELRDVDVIISWQVLEHVSSLPSALANLRAMLRPGGTLLAQTPGAFAVFALAARVMPHRLRVKALARLLGHLEEDKFPTHYDRCTARALRKLLGGWEWSEIVPFYRGAPYFSWSRPLQQLYLGYENFIAARGWENLATHYLLIARP